LAFIYSVAEGPIHKELLFTLDEGIAKWRDERKKKYPTTIK